MFSLLLYIHDPPSSARPNIRTRRRPSDGLSERERLQLGLLSCVTRMSVSVLLKESGSLTPAQLQLTDISCGVPSPLSGFPNKAVRRSSSQVKSVDGEEAFAVFSARFAEFRLV